MSNTLELYLKRPNELELRTAEMASRLKDNEVKIKMIYGGICGSDLRVYQGAISYAQYPIRPGHEALGTIIEAGAAVPYDIGTRVVVFPNTFCGTCEFCLNEKTNICIKKKPLGVAIDGVFAQEVILDAKYVFPVPGNLPDERAILIEPFAVTIHALKKASILPGTTVAIVGCGTEGLLAVALALHLGAKVTAIDVNPVKLEIAKALGAVTALMPQAVNGELFDVVVEAAGVKAAIQQAMQIVKPGGTMIALGITGEPVNMSPIHIVRNEISILGTIIYTLKDFADAIEYLSCPSLFVEPVISKVVPLADYQAAYAQALSGNYAKILLAFAR
ncbi:zinc-dependent alcohol dehydrogenase [Sporolituus thermophilus]|uniref:L-iditol 2-dehydrogenase n=1 Tax=Sporolituus thermophilus DSM 23256 TaxID=1123285 RepID=A0A1G7LAG2_9FIRM|nr:alcohol dehydrogenase catalytic domain-containing protein [Sporolituus thermophilus]SDF46371.1 L-iditol 2-dehydrogenase [Sporolituus thermophilus DSM 23256]